MEIPMLRSSSMDGLPTIEQEYDKDLEEKFSSFVSAKDFLEGSDESANSSHIFKSLADRVAYSSKMFLYKLGIASLEACQFILENPEIFTLPLFLGLMPSVASEFDFEECMGNCRDKYMGYSWVTLPGYFECYRKCTDDLAKAALRAEL
jgi:hypothetical protein